MADNKWSKPASPPPPMFLGEKERNLVKRVNDEIIERVIGQQVLYFPIDMARTDFHPVYGEAIEKTFLHPIRVYALVDYGGVQTTYLDNIGLDKQTDIVVNFHKRRLTEDQDLYVREGDFVLYGDFYYELVTLKEPKQLFGQIDHRMEISAKAIRAREGLFDAT